MLKQGRDLAALPYTDSDSLLRIAGCGAGRQVALAQCFRRTPARLRKALALASWLFWQMESGGVSRSTAHLFAVSAASDARQLPPASNQ